MILRWSLYKSEIKTLPEALEYFVPSFEFSNYHYCCVKYHPESEFDLKINK